jgi:hypothetical protein
MTQDEVIELAREAGFEYWWDSGNESIEVFQMLLKRFAKLVAAKEREALAQPEQEPMAWCAQSELDWLNSDKRGASAYVKTTLSKRRDGLAQTALYTASTQLEEHNFCPRCGKRNKDIHTCTPPQD